MEVSMRVANRKIITGGAKRVLPKAAKNAPFIKTGYSFI
jgi:hypothetical protein